MQDPERTKKSLLNHVVELDCFVASGGGLVSQTRNLRLARDLEEAGTAGAGMGCPGVRLFRVEDDDASMSSAAVWVRRVLLRVRMVGAY